MWRVLSLLDQYCAVERFRIMKASQKRQKDGRKKGSSNCSDCFIFETDATGENQQQKQKMSVFKKTPESEGGRGRYNIPERSVSDKETRIKDVPSPGKIPAVSESWK